MPTKRRRPWRAAVTLPIFLACSLAPAAAVPPPPQDPAGEAVTGAIAALTPFLGEWEGEWTQESPYGTERTPVSRTVRRVGNAILLIRNGAGPEELCTIAYDPASHTYKFGFPGYRAFQGAGQVFELELLDHDTIRWREPRREPLTTGIGVRSFVTTVSVENGQWRERVQAEDEGRVQLLWDITLHRTS